MEIKKRYLEKNVRLFETLIYFLKGKYVDKLYNKVIFRIIE